mgnify:CR=1 FL=1
MANQFEYHDYFDLDDQLTEDVQIARDAVREWVQSEISPHIEEHAMAGTFDKGWFLKLGSLGSDHPYGQVGIAYQSLLLCRGDFH